MNEELMKKLVESLKSRGMSDEDIEGVKLELTEKTEDKETPEEPKGDDVPTAPAEEPKVEEEAKVEEKKEEQPANTDETDSKVEEKEEVKEEVKPDEVPPTEEPKEETKPAEDGNKLPEGVKEFDPENPVVPEPTPEVPQTPDYEAQYNEMKMMLEEERKAREGLQVRLEDALRVLEESGIIRSSGKPASNIGIDDPTRVDDLHEQETTMGAVLKDINTY